MLFKILIVENEKNLLENLTDHLQREGYRIELTRNWESALDLAHQFHPNLIILDTMLPGINGVDLARQRFNDAQIYFWSARESDPPKDNGLGICAKDDFRKTFSTLELPARIKAHYRSVQILEMLQEDSIVA